MRKSLVTKFVYGHLCHQEGWIILVGQLYTFLYRHTKLKSGDMGTITELSLLPEGNKQIWVNWDNGSRLALWNVE